MNIYHGASIFFDIFYLFDLICDCRYYGFYDYRGFLIKENKKIWIWMKKQKARFVFKLLLCLPLYLFSNSLYCSKLLSVIHFRTLQVFGQKIAFYVYRQFNYRYRCFSLKVRIHFLCRR